jgi:hypothetical protein
VLNNPVADGVLKVQLGKPVKMSLYNSQGQLIWQGQGKAGSNSININGIGKGVYLVKAGLESEKIVVK